MRKVLEATSVELACRSGGMAPVKKRKMDLEPSVRTDLAYGSPKQDGPFLPRPKES